MNAPFTKFARVWGMLAMLWITAYAQNAWAIPIILTDPNPKYTATVEGCPDHEWCAVNTTLDMTTVKYGDTRFNDLFKKGFDSWNSNQPDAAKWSLADGGTTLAAGFAISTFQAQIAQVGGNWLGGVEINVEFIYAGSDRSDYWWAQGIFANYLPGGPVAPYYYMDTTDLSTCIWVVCSSPPLYPYQYADRSFYDLPRADFPDNFFEANAFLTKVDFTNRILTVYEGIHYGYALSVPEPGVFILVLIGMGVMGFVRISARHCICQDKAS